MVGQPGGPSNVHYANQSHWQIVLQMNIIFYLMHLQASSGSFNEQTISAVTRDFATGLIKSEKIKVLMGRAT